MIESTTITAIPEILKVAEDLQQQQRFLEAIVKYKEIVKIDRSHWQSWRQLAKLYQQQNQLTAATECLRKLITLKPKQSDFYRDLANLLSKQDKKEELIEICQQLIDLSPKQPLWVYSHLNTVNNSEDLVEKAIFIYQTAIAQEELQPVFVYDSLIKGLLEKKQLSPAHDTVIQALKKYPKNHHLWMSLADIKYQLGNVEDAIQNYQQAIALEAIPQVYLKLGNIYQKQNQLDEAIAAYEKAKHLFPQTNIEVYRKLGECYQKQQQLKLAISAYEKIVFLMDNRYESRQIHSTLNYLYLQQGSIDLAQKHYRLQVADNCLINHKHKIIYCPIPKNACSIFKIMMVEHSEDRERYLNSQINIHRYASALKNTAVVLDNLDYLKRPDYFKFTILRNPFNRLVSAYLDKIVKREIPEVFAQELIHKVQQSINKNYDLEKSISFQEFIQYVANTEDYYLNPHWKSQSSFLGRGWIKFDYLGQFEQLDKVIANLENKFGFQISTNVSRSLTRTDHVTEYITDILPDKYYAKYPQELRNYKLKHGGFPDAASFWNSELIELVKIRFAQDIELYNSQFTSQKSKVPPHLRGIISKVKSIFSLKPLKSMID